MVIQEVDLDNIGNYYQDFKADDNNAPLGPKQDNSTWHHHQNMTTMQEVNKKYHRRFRHKGGMSNKTKGES